jgi:hypothetical protein
MYHPLIALHREHVQLTANIKEANSCTSLNRDATTGPCVGLPGSRSDSAATGAIRSQDPWPGAALVGSNPTPSAPRSKRRLGRKREPAVSAC